MADNFFYLASLVIFTFGALTLSILTATYWSERWRGKFEGRPRKRTVFPAFTLVCAAVFLLNLLSQIATPWTGALALARGLAASLLPPLMLHLVYERDLRDLPGRRIWRATLFGLYAAAVGSAVANGLDETGWLVLPGIDLLARAPAAALLATGVLGLAMEACSRRNPQAAGRAYRRWVGALLSLMAICAAVNLAQPGGPARMLPDYLLLAFFCVSLYYRERLAFFDVLVKRGAFFIAGLVILTACFELGSHYLFRLPRDWSAWVCALLLAPLWLLGPWIYARMDRAIDRLWLHRRYSAADAERHFINEVQAAATEAELCSRATASLSGIFRTRAEVQFAAGPPAKPSGCDDSGLAAVLEQNGARTGSIALSPRPDSIPFLSDDRRLLASLARTLSVVLENLRFRLDRRRQEEREQQLRFLASRAELKALRAQINPHFLFNALNAIAGLIHDQPALADETIQQLAQVFRYTLRKSESEWVSLAEEVEFATAYLRVEQARYGERLCVSFHVDPAAALAAIPAMSVQPLIENAIKHGVSAVEGHGMVALRAALEGSFLVVEVRDNGPGFPPGFSLHACGAGHGLRNVAERLLGYYGNTGGLRWENAPDGARVLLRLPLGPTLHAARGDAHDARADCG